MVTFKDSGNKRKSNTSNSESEWMDKVCLHCGYRYGWHHSFDDKCPTESWI